MATVWQRPDSIRFPKRWKTFKGSIEIDGQIPKFRIQDIPEQKYDLVVDLLVKKFVQEEALVTEARDFWRRALEQRLSLVCLARTLDKTAEIVSISINCRSTPNDPQVTLKFGSEWLIQQHMLQIDRFYEQFNVEEVITGAGSLTRPKYLNENVCVEMIKCRGLLCKATGIKMTFSIVAPVYKEALKSEGYKDYKTLDSEVLNKTTNTALIPEGTCLKFMYNSYE